MGLPFIQYSAFPNVAPLELKMAVPGHPKAAIHYALGSQATLSSETYRGPLKIDRPTTVSSIAVVDGLVIKASETFRYPELPDVLFSLDDRLLKMWVPGFAFAEIFYTLDGSQPSEASDFYISPIKVKLPVTVNAMATAPQWDSIVSSAYYPAEAVQAPVFNPPNGVPPLNVNLSVPGHPGAKIYFSTDGRVPRAGKSMAVSSAIYVDRPCRVLAIAVEHGYSNSPLATADYQKF